MFARERSSSDESVPRFSFHLPLTITVPSAGMKFSIQRRFFSAVRYSQSQLVRRFCNARKCRSKNMEDRMPTFILSLNWTDQGIRAVKDAPQRAQAASDLAKKVGVEIREVYLTSGDNDLLLIIDAPNGDNVAKFALALGSQGNVRTRTARAWPQSEFQKLISELP